MQLFTEEPHLATKIVMLFRKKCTFTCTYTVTTLVSEMVSATAIRQKKKRQTKIRNRCRYRSCDRNHENSNLISNTMSHNWVFFTRSKSENFSFAEKSHGVSTEDVPIFSRRNATSTHYGGPAIPAVFQIRITRYGVLSRYYCLLTQFERTLVELTIGARFNSRYE